MRIKPVIKWSGSKNSQATKIVNRIPNKKYNNYYEPFLGSGSVLYTLLNSDKVNNFNKFIVSDLNIHLIDFFNMLRNDPRNLSDNYRLMWNQMKDIESIEKKKEFYNLKRGEFNKDPSPPHFLFLTRTCINGLIRYNSKGAFNSPLHLNRDGIHPDRLDKIILEWHELINLHDVQIIHRSYDEITPGRSDFMYMDPPYTGSGAPMYLGKFDIKSFIQYVTTIPGDVLLSYDGYSGNVTGSVTDNVTNNVEKQLLEIPGYYHEFIQSGKSSYRRLIGGKDEMVFESLYRNFV